jgi:hypothetical protein
MHDAVARGVGNYHNQHTHGRCPMLCNTAPLGRDAIFLTRIREANTDSRPTEIPRPTYARALPCAIQYRPVGARIYFLRGDTEIQRYRDTEIQRYGDAKTRRHEDTETRRHGYAKPTRIADQRRFHAPGASTLHGMTLGVRFWRCCRTLQGMKLGVTFWRCCRTLQGMTLGVRFWRRYRYPRKYKCQVACHQKAPHTLQCWGVGGDLSTVTEWW